MLQIVRVGALDGDKLDIEFDNGHIVLLELESKMLEPAFAALREDDRICYPKTDGGRVYWRDGPSLTVDEIMEILQESQKWQLQAKDNNKNHNKEENKQ